MSDIQIIELELLKIKRGAIAFEIQSIERSKYFHMPGYKERLCTEIDSLIHALAKVDLSIRLLEYTLEDWFYFRNKKSSKSM